MRTGGWRSLSLEECALGKPSVWSPSHKTGHLQTHSHTQSHSLTLTLLDLVSDSGSDSDSDSDSFLSPSLSLSLSLTLSSFPFLFFLFGCNEVRGFSLRERKVAPLPTKKSETSIAAGVVSISFKFFFFFKTLDWKCCFCGEFHSETSSPQLNGSSQPPLACRVPVLFWILPTCRSRGLSQEKRRLSLPVLLSRLWKISCARQMSTRTSFSHSVETWNRHPASM